MLSLTTGEQTGKQLVGSDFACSKEDYAGGVASGNVIRINCRSISHTRTIDKFPCEKEIRHTNDTGVFCDMERVLNKQTFGAHDAMSDEDYVCDANMW
eukprot:374208-Pelagomonas_calceolata.AAC.1